MFFSEECRCSEEGYGDVDEICTELVVFCLYDSFFPFSKFKFDSDDGIVFDTDEICSAVTYFDFVFYSISLFFKVGFYRVNEFKFIVEGCWCCGV